MNEEKPQNIKSLSAVRIIATACVVLLHTCWMATSLYGTSITSMERVSSLTVTHLMMVAIPLFVMTTGALLLDPNKDITIEKILKKYVLRILIALVLFSAVYKIFDIAMSQGAESFNLQALKEYFIELITGSGWSHLWYLYMLIALYLLLPAFRAITKDAESPTAAYLLIVGFIFLCILPIYRKMAAGQSIAFYIDVATVYPVYLLAGYAIYNRKPDISSYSPVLIIIGLLGIIAVSIMRYGSSQIEELDCFLGYSSPFTFIASVGTFDILSHKKITKESSNNFIKLVDPLTFGIYLLHVIFLRLFLRYFAWNPYTGNIFTAVNILGIALLSFIISLFLSAVLKKIPGIRKVV